MPDAVIFDVNGTLINSVDLQARAWHAAFEHYGKRVPYLQVRAQIGKARDPLLRVFLSDGEVDRYGDELARWRDDLYRKDFLPRARPFPNVRDLFTRLKSDGVRLAVASSSPADEVEGHLKLCDVVPLVDAVVTTGDVEKAKPEPDLFEAALEKLGDLEDGRAVVVGDSPYDGQAALRAGLEPIGVLSGGFNAAELRAAGCRLLFDDCTDLLHRYSSWRKPARTQAGEEFVLP